MESAVVRDIIEKFKRGKRLTPAGVICRNPHEDGKILIIDVNYDSTQSDEEYGEHVYASFYPCEGDTPIKDEDRMDVANLQDFDSFSLQLIQKGMDAERPPVEYDDEESEADETDEKATE
jgi:hypothetical protein